MATDLDYPVVCQGVLGTTEGRSESSLLAPSSGMNNEVAFAKVCINVKGLLMNSICPGVYRKLEASENT
jgi:hypothetical protein